MKQVRNSELTLGRLPQPNQPVTLRAELLESGVPTNAVESVEKILARESIALGAQAIRQIALRLGKTPAGAALRYAILGSEGRSLAEIAAEHGTSKQSLFVAIGRVQARLQ